MLDSNQPIQSQENPHHHVVAATIGIGMATHAVWAGAGYGAKHMRPFKEGSALEGTRRYLANGLTESYGHGRWGIHVGKGIIDHVIIGTAISAFMH